VDERAVERYFLGVFGILFVGETGRTMVAGRERKGCPQKHGVRRLSSRYIAVFRLKTEMCVHHRAAQKLSQLGETQCQKINVKSAGGNTTTLYRARVCHGSVEEIQPLISFCASSAEAVRKRGYFLIIAKQTKGVVGFWFLVFGFCPPEPETGDTQRNAPCVSRTSPGARGRRW
jgi:hypothetical protein